MGVLHGFSPLSWRAYKRDLGISSEIRTFSASSRPPSVRCLEGRDSAANTRETVMNMFTEQKDDLVDLGSVTAETKGLGSQGPIDFVTGLRQYDAGLSTD